MNKSLGIDEKNRRLLDSLNRFGHKLFSVDEAAKIIDLPMNDTRLYLAYLTRRGWLARIKPGLYTSVPLGIVNPQEYKENPWIVANQIFAPCYIGGWSAAAYWSLTDQLSNSIFVYTSRTFRKKEINIQGTDFVLKLKKNIEHTKSVWVENEKIQVSNPTQTIVDILNDPAFGGGMRHVAEIIKNYFESDQRNDIDLQKYIIMCKNRTIYKRLGFILEKKNISAKDIIEVSRRNISAGYSIFDPTIISKGRFNRRWNLKVNTEIAK